MAKKATTGLWMAAFVCLVVFLTLFGIRLGLFSTLFLKNTPSVALSGQSLPDRETWMKVLQNDRRIGYSHSVFKKADDHYTLEESLLLQVTVMGLTNRVNLHLDAVLNNNLTLRSFDSRLRSGQFTFSATGRIQENTLIVTTEAEGRSQKIRLPVDKTPYLSAGLIYAVCNSGMAPGDSMSVSIFDPSSMAVVPVKITVEKKENIMIMGMNQAATRILIAFQGLTQQIWISETGEILKESGLMGLSLEKTDKHEALAKIEGGRGDLTQMLAIKSNVVFKNPGQLQLLQAKLEDVDLKNLSLTGGRQSMAGRVLTIKKESTSNNDGEVTAKIRDEFLRPDALVQSDDPEIRKLAAEIAPAGNPDWDRAERLMRWVYENIEKKPVVSIPNALSTLAHREGDCNEHAMLLAALARAAGIPAQVETGLVYLKGHFFYHAWNRLYVGQWITADATFGQMPADVTHIRLAGGKPNQQMNLIPVIGKLKLIVTDYAPRR